MRLLIIRHGDPDYERDGLTEKGRREAKLLADSLAAGEWGGVDALYCSPLGRARATCAYTAEALGMKPTVLPWLREFDYRVDLPDGEKNHLIWDMLPSFREQYPVFGDRDGWSEPSFMQAGNIRSHYEEVTSGLDSLLADRGYVREGDFYRAERPNRETLAFFCHFGVESVLLSWLFGVSPIATGHGLIALPTSVTTLYTEERRRGKAVFRCCGFGEISHLRAGGEPPSFSGRFCETFDGDERHD